MKTDNSQINTDQIFLFEIINFFIVGWKKIFLGGIISSALGMSHTLLLPKLYSATAKLELVKIFDTNLIDPNNLIERMMIPTIYSFDVFVACRMENLTNPGETLVRTLKPSLSMRSSIITIQYEDKSAEDAKKCLESVISSINDNLQEIKNPLINFKKNQLNDLKQDLNQLEKNIKISTTPNAMNQITLMKIQIANLETALNAADTKLFRLIAPIISSNIPIERKLIRTTLGSGIAGIGLVIIFLLSRNIFQTYKKQTSLLNS